MTTQDAPTPSPYTPGTMADNLHRGHVSIGLALISWIISCVDMHPSMIGVIVALINAVLLVYLRFLSKTEEPHRHKSLAIIAISLGCTSLMEFPPNKVMLIVFVTNLCLLFAIREVGKLEVKYGNAA
jgi:hypothetical protein